MNVEYMSTQWSHRARAWAMSKELTDNGNGTYSVNDTYLASTFGIGSEIIVIDIPGKLLFWDAETQLAYDWTGSGSGGGGGDVPAGYVVVAPEQTVTLDGSEEVGVELTVAEGTIVPYYTPVDWYVKVDGKQLEYQEVEPGSGHYEYSIVESGVVTLVSAYSDNPSADGSVILSVFDMPEYTPVPGTHTVEIYGPDYSDTVPAGYVSVAPKQGVTVGADEFGVIILSEYTLPSELSEIPTNFEVSVNGQMLEYYTDHYNHYEYVYEDANVAYVVSISSVNQVNCLLLDVTPTPSEPVTYTVAIYAPEDSGDDIQDEQNL